MTQRRKPHEGVEPVTIHLEAKEGKRSGDLQKLGKGMNQIIPSLQVRQECLLGYAIQLECSFVWGLSMAFLKEGGL